MGKVIDALKSGNEIKGSGQIQCGGIHVVKGDPVFDTGVDGVHCAVAIEASVRITELLSWHSAARAICVDGRESIGSEGLAGNGHDSTS